MLGFVWRAEHAGAPDNATFAIAADHLFLRPSEGVENPVQSFAKAGAAPAPASAGLTAAIAAWIARRGRGGAVVLVHGYSWAQADLHQFDFGEDPYRSIFAANGTGVECWLPMVGAENAVCFAWTSMPGLHDYARACWSNPYEYAVQDLAPQAARALATLIAALVGAGLTVDLLAHSLGTRVAIKAVQLLSTIGTDHVRRAVMLGGAEYSVDALQTSVLVATDFYNFVIRDDVVLRWGAAKLGGKDRPNNTMLSRVIGRDGMKPTRNWIDFQLDHEDPENAQEFFEWFDRLGG